ncbi:Sugar/inositol transporter [Macrophomina phaseolina MS6]|uniref:Sugar/inositol transporter n=2 Tax=Macrophomina phaseolina TaxID=35725 RepID=K2R8B4_MACPH|nr:Sugar/inositol transporter [Macrophomina phaseolina MS6]
MGFLLIGFDNGLMGGLVGATAFNDTFNKPGATMIGLIVAIYEVGCFFGAVVTSIIGETLGRKKSIAIGIVIMVVGALVQATAYSRAHLIVARIVSGVGMGFINSTVPVLQAEFSPKATRGVYVCAQLSTLNFGIFLVYWIDYAFSSHKASYAWRVPVILQCVFLIPMAFILLIIPESPRWLARHDRPEEALEVLLRLHKHNAAPAEVAALHADIVHTAAMEASIGAGSWKDLLKEDEIKSRTRLLIACSIQAFQQLGGINAIIYYSATLFKNSIGFSDHMSALMSGFLQTWFFLASFIPWALIDRIGRRPLLLSMISVMAAAMAVQAALIYQVQHKTSIQHAAGIGAAFILFLYQGAFTIGFQATVWVYPSEILPLRLRQRGSSISTAANWIINFAVVQFTPPAIANIGWRTYIIFAVLNTAFLPVIYIFYPETKGMQLEDVDRLFSKTGEFERESIREKGVVEHVEEMNV